MVQPTSKPPPVQRPSQPMVEISPQDLDTVKLDIRNVSSVTNYGIALCCMPIKAIPVYVKPLIFALAFCYQPETRYVYRKHLLPKYYRYQRKSDLEAALVYLNNQIYQDDRRKKVSNMTSSSSDFMALQAADNKPLSDLTNEDKALLFPLNIVKGHVKAGGFYLIGAMCVACTIPRRVPLSVKPFLIATVLLQTPSCRDITRTMILPRVYEYQNKPKLSLALDYLNQRVDHHKHQKNDIRHLSENESDIRK
jgi:hypothetical protein